MELEVIRACAAGLADPTIGINVMIDGLTLDTIGDARPSHVPIYNYVDHPWVARKSINVAEARNAKVTIPCIAVYLEAPPIIDPEVQTTYRDGDYSVALGYLSIDTDDAKKMRDALYVNRALLRFLTQFNSETYKAMRFRNGVNLYVAKRLVQFTPFDTWGEPTLAAQTVVTYRCREHQP